MKAPATGQATPRGLADEAFIGESTRRYSSQPEFSVPRAGAARPATGLTAIAAWSRAIRRSADLAKHGFHVVSADGLLEASDLVPVMSISGFPSVAQSSIVDER